jgi:hypothetical protein
VVEAVEKRVQLVHLDLLELVIVTVQLRKDIQQVIGVEVAPIVILDGIVLIVIKGKVDVIGEVNLENLYVKELLQ